MRAGTIVCIATFILGSLLALAQMWFAPMSAETFVKVEITLGVVFVVVLGTTLAAREFLQNEKLRKSGHLE